MEQVLLGLLSQYPWGALILSALGTLVVVGQVVVVLTPSKKDDAILDDIKKGMFGKLLDMIAAFAPIQRK